MRKCCLIEWVEGLIDRIATPPTTTEQAVNVCYSNVWICNTDLSVSWTDSIRYSFLTATMVTRLKRSYLRVYCLHNYDCDSPWNENRKKPADLKNSEEQIVSLLLLRRAGPINFFLLFTGTSGGMKVTFKILLFRMTFLILYLNYDVVMFLPQNLG